MDAKEFIASREAAADYAVNRGKAAGPVYREKGSPLVWNDQIFQEAFEPAGTVECETALRAGNNGVDMALIASPTNKTDVVCPQGATITVTFLVADAQDGEFVEAGPTVCIKAPEEGMTAAPGETLYRFPLGGFPKPWLKTKLEFSGTITGGALDCALVYMPR